MKTLEQTLQEMQLHAVKNVHKAVNQLWDMYDQEKAKGNTTQADAYAAQAFQLLERLPENQVYLQVRQ